jgi:integrase
MSVSVAVETAAEPPIGGRISQWSVFSDKVWQFDNHVPGSKNAICNWEIELGDGSMLTDPQHADWLDDSRRFLLALKDDDTRSKGKPKPGSLLKKASYLRQLIGWMSARKVLSYGNLTIENLRGYRNNLRRRKRKTSLNGSSTNKSDLLAQSTRRDYLNICRLLVLHQKSLSRPVSFTLREFDKCCAADMRKRKSAAKTPRIPDAIFAAILEAAFYCVTTIAPLAIVRLKQFREIRKASPKAWERVDRYKAFCENTVPEQCVTVALRSFNFKALAYHESRTWVSHVAAACFIVIAGLVGMRASEILSLKEGCLQTLKARDNRDLLIINGRCFKTEQDVKGKPCSWVAGWDSPTNPVRLAVEILEQLQAAFGSPTTNGSLFMPLDDHDTRQTKREATGSSRQTWVNRINAFAKVNAIAQWQFAPHQFRKTFARFVILRDPAGIVALQRHFKHVSTAMAERYCPTDPDLMSEIIEASLEEDRSVLDTILRANRLAGKKGEEMSARAAPFRGESPEAAMARQTLLDELMDDPSFHIVRHPYGPCLYERSKANCGGKLANVGIWTCIDCSNLAVGEQHLPFWEDLHASVICDRREMAARGIVSIELELNIGRVEAIIQKLKANG